MQSIARMHKLAENDLPLLQKAREYDDAAKVRALEMYPFFRPISSAQDTEVIMNGQKVLMLGSNSYLGPDQSPQNQRSHQASGGQVWQRLRRVALPERAPWIFTRNWRRRWPGWSAKRRFCSTAPDSRSTPELSACWWAGTNISWETRATTPASWMDASFHRGSYCGLPITTCRRWSSGCKKSIPKPASSSWWTVFSAWKATSFGCRSCAGWPNNTGRR